MTTAASRRPLRRARGGERGSAVAELALVLPALMLVVAFALQMALWAIASHAVQASAATGGDVVRALGGTPAEAVEAARGEIAGIARGLVLDPSVLVTSGAGDEDVVVVSGDVPSIFPGLHLHVSAASIGPAGEFRGSG